MLPPPPQSPAWRPSQHGLSAGQAGLQQELSFAALPKQQSKQHLEGNQPGGHNTAGDAQQQPGPARAQTQALPDNAPTNQKGSIAASLPRLQLGCSTELGSDALCRSAVLGKAGGAEDEVLFDAELASYISETDYTDLREADLEVRGVGGWVKSCSAVLRSSLQDFAKAWAVDQGMQTLMTKSGAAWPQCVLCAVSVQVDNHLLAELQVVLADKAALEEEKAAAQVPCSACRACQPGCGVLLCLCSV